MSAMLLEHPAIVGGVEYVIDPAQVRERRLRLGWSQEDLAERAGITGRTVSNAEHGKIGDATALRITMALDAGEAEKLEAARPDLETITVEIDGMKVVVTGDREKVDRIDLNALIRPRGDK
jgi:transcriptional regulator with XRE-family HTH domain